MFFRAQKAKRWTKSKSIKTLMSALRQTANNIYTTLIRLLYHWYRCSELSADRIAVICCGSAIPVIETMMRLAGGTTHIDSEINKDLFISQAADYKQIIDESKVNKALEFLLTKDNEHPLLAIRAYEAQQFAVSEEFLSIANV